MASTKGSAASSSSPDAASSPTPLIKEAPRMNPESRDEKEAPKKAGNDKPDVGIFSVAAKTQNDDDESFLGGFCATYKKAQSSSNSISRDDAEEEHQWTEGVEDGGECTSGVSCVFVSITSALDSHFYFVDVAAMNPPLAKKQRLVPVPQPSLLLDSYPDILENVYSFLTLKEALVLRRTCRQLNNDTDIFRCSLIVDSNMVARIKFDQAHAYHVRYLDLQERALYNLTRTADLRALLRNETLPQSMIVDFLKNLIAKSTKDNGEAVSVLLQDDRVVVEPKMLDMALRKDYAAMAAALQQNEQVKASIRMCATCSVNIGAYECFKGLECMRLPNSGPGDSALPAGFKLPKYCRTCARTNHLFCKCGEYLCQECLAGHHIECCDCGNIACGRGECVLRACPRCAFDKCSTCTADFSPYCYPCGDMQYDYNSYSDNYHYRHYGYGDSDSEY